MALSDFIRGHHKEIIGEFEAFARTLMPPGVNMITVQLRDHAEEMLIALVEDMENEQSLGEQARKAQGQGADNTMAESGHQHADARIQHGFTTAQLLAEFRALRASVLGLYEKSGATDLGGVRRFNEAIDEVLTESMTRYSAMTDLYREQFVGVLSHDLRTPLGAIMAGAALLATSAGADQRQARVSGRILRSAQRMTRMIKDLLDLTLARLGGAIPLKRVPTDLTLVCHEAVLEIQTAHAGTAVRFESSDDLTGDWDGDRLAQLLSNLLGNAIQHGDGREVSLTVRSADTHVVISVHNWGTPIPPEAQQVIFEPLVRRAAVASEEGNSIGLGLFIARAIATSHGGEIQVTSSESEGTTFTVRLPRREPAAAG